MTENNATTAMIDHGYDLAVKARAPGAPEPKLSDAVWELLIEGMETLRRLPDREVNCLRAADRSHMPQIIRKMDDEFGAEVDRVGMGEAPRETVIWPGAPSKAAIDRMEKVLDWYSLGGNGRPARRGMQTLYLLAAGVKPRYVAELTRVNAKHYHSTLYSRRDRALAEIVVHIDEEIRKVA